MKFKLFILICLVFTCRIGFGQNSRISSFNELMKSLNAGEHVRVVIHYARCQWSSDHIGQSPVPDAITGMPIDTYEYFAAGAAHNKAAFIVFSNSKLIQNPIGKGFVYNYGKVRINSDNTVTIIAKYLQPRNFKVLMDETFIGKLDDGGIELFSGH